MEVLVPIADGSEEIETVCIVDTLVRAGANVTVVSVQTGTLQCTMSRGVKMTADAMIEDVASKEYNCIALPGGMPGAKTIGECEPFIALLKRHAEANKLYGAICAAPAVALLPNGLLPAGEATCHPGFADKLPNCSEKRVVHNGQVVTSRGPGTAIEFALKLVELLVDEEKAKAVAGPMLVHMP